MNAPVYPPFPSNPSVGQIFGGWVWNGSTWIPSPPTGGMTVNLQKFLTSGTYMPSAGLTSLVVECIGGGGGGGGPGQTDVNEAIAAGGGGAGGYSRKYLPASLVLGGIIVTIGAGGAGGAMPTTGQTTQSGGNGGATSFGALCVANGGYGGNLGPGIGAPEGVGDIVFAGSPGQGGFYFDFAGFVGTIWTTPGGSSPYGGGPSTTHVVPKGQAVGGDSVYPNSGAGGMGGASNQSSGTGAAGGQGSSGICWVIEYLWAVSGGPPGCAPVPFVGWDGSCC